MVTPGKGRRERLAGVYWGVLFPPSLCPRQKVPLNGMITVLVLTSDPGKETQER